MKAYKVEILVIDFDELGVDGIRDQLENARFPNHCMSPRVKCVIEKDIGEWDDSHPLNLRSTMDAEYNRLFNQDNK